MKPYVKQSLPGRWLVISGVGGLHFTISRPFPDQQSAFEHAVALSAVSLAPEKEKDR